MDSTPSNSGVFRANNDLCGDNRMEITSTQHLIKQLKDAKREKEITYPRLMEMLEKNGKSVSLTTLRRVFADGSEWNDSFNYESTLLPLAEVLINNVDIPIPSDSPYATEIEGLKSVIHVQNEEIARLHELKEHLEARVTFLLEQIEKKDRRMDEKDEMIHDIMKERNELFTRVLQLLDK